jgi:hypothetical protein
MDDKPPPQSRSGGFPLARIHVSLKECTQGIAPLDANLQWIGLKRMRRKELRTAAKKRRKACQHATLKRSHNATRRRKARQALTART